MVCKNECLLVVNLIFIIFASILIGVSSYARDANIAIIYHHCQFLPIFGGIIACGVFLLLVAALGLIATFKQSQALIYVYIIILSILCVLQFFTSIASLLVKHETNSELVFSAWNLIDNLNSPSKIHSIQRNLGCCGINDTDKRRQHDNYNNNGTCTGKWCEEIEFCISDQIPACKKPKNVTSSPLDFGCPTCIKTLVKILDTAFHSTGGIGLFLSFCEFSAYYYISGNGANWS